MLVPCVCVLFCDCFRGPLSCSATRCLSFWPNSVSLLTNRMQSKWFMGGECVFKKNQTGRTWHVLPPEILALRLSASSLKSRRVKRARWTSAADRSPRSTRPRTDTSWWWDGCRYDEVICDALLGRKGSYMNQAVCHRRLPLGLGRGNVCGVWKTHEKPLHVSLGDPRGEINASDRNTPGQKHLASLNELALLNGSTFRICTYELHCLDCEPNKTS